MCFLVSITMIGLLTALIGDLASHFGCSVGLKDSINAISLVALGTSLPGEYTDGYISKFKAAFFLDTFASKTAAIGDETADGSIGNVTGSNAVNVFLGIGIAWLLAAIVHYVGVEVMTLDNAFTDSRHTRRFPRAGRQSLL